MVDHDDGLWRESVHGKLLLLKIAWTVVEATESRVRCCFFIRDIAIERSKSLRA